MQQFLTTFVLCGSVLSSLFVIYKVVRIAVRVEDNLKTTENLGKKVVELDKKVTDMSDELKKTSLMSHKEAFYNCNLPYEERIYNGECYIEEGGNGIVKKHVQLALETGSIPVVTKCDQLKYTLSKQEIAMIVEGKISEYMLNHEGKLVKP